MIKNESVPELTNGEFDSFTGKGLVFLDFFAEWCMPCTIMSPIIEELSHDFEGKIKFGRVNVDDNSRIARKYGILSIPTFILLKNSEIIERFLGAVSQEELNEVLKRYS